MQIIQHKAEKQAPASKFELIEPERVGDDRHGAEGHGGAGDRRNQQGEVSRVRCQTFNYLKESPLLFGSPQREGGAVPEKGRQRPQTVQRGDRQIRSSTQATERSQAI